MRGILFSLAIILILLLAAGAWRSVPNPADPEAHQPAREMSHPLPAAPPSLGAADLAQIIELRRQFRSPLSSLEPAAPEGDVPGFEKELRRIGQLDAPPAHTPAKNAALPPIAPRID